MGKYTKEATDANFSEVIAKGNVLVDFWAPWCGPCQQLGPIMEELAEEMKDKLVVYKLNVDENPQISSQMGIRGIPAVIMFQDGKPCFNHSGAHPKQFWIDNINQHI